MGVAGKVALGCCALLIAAGCGGSHHYSGQHSRKSGHHRHGAKATPPAAAAVTAVKVPTGPTEPVSLDAPVRRTVAVSTSDQLAAALAGAKPGDLIRLADGVYAGKFTAAPDGTAAEPVTLRGSRNAVIDGGGVRAGRALTLTGDWWHLVGFTIRNAQKGLMAEGAHHTVVDGLLVHDIGDEAVHFQKGSSDNVVQRCDIHDTGKRRPGFGEGIYFGSARSNWTGGQIDHSDRNVALYNHLGPNIAAEAIDIKEGTTAGVVRGNQFDGHGQTGENSGESWVNAKGNDYLIAANTGTAAYASGYKTRTQYDGYGCGNVFTANTGTVDPHRKPGWSFDISNNGQCADHLNVLCDDNKVTGAANGVSQATPARCPSR